MVQLRALSLRLAGIAASMLSASIFVPLALTVYDSLIVPITLKAWKSEGSCFEIAVAMLVAAIVLPLQIGKTFFGINADVADLVSESCDTAINSSVETMSSMTDVDVD